MRTYCLTLKDLRHQALWKEPLKPKAAQDCCKAAFYMKMHRRAKNVLTTNQLQHQACKGNDKGFGFQPHDQSGLVDVTMMYAGSSSSSAKAWQLWLSLTFNGSAETAEKAPSFWHGLTGIGKQMNMMYACFTCQMATVHCLLSCCID